MPNPNEEESSSPLNDPEVKRAQRRVMKGLGVTAGFIVAGALWGGCKVKNEIQRREQAEAQFRQEERNKSDLIDAMIKDLEKNKIPKAVAYDSMPFLTRDQWQEAQEERCRVPFEELPQPRIAIKIVDRRLELEDGGRNGYRLMPPAFQDLVPPDEAQANKASLKLFTEGFDPWIMSPPKDLNNIMELVRYERIIAELTKQNVPLSKFLEQAKLALEHYQHPDEQSAPETLLWDLTPQFREILKLAQPKAEIDWLKEASDNLKTARLQLERLKRPEGVTLEQHDEMLKQLQQMEDILLQLQERTPKAKGEGNAR